MNTLDQLLDEFDQQHLGVVSQWNLYLSKAEGRAIKTFRLDNTIPPDCHQTDTLQALDDILHQSGFPKLHIVEYDTKPARDIGHYSTMLCSRNEKGHFDCSHVS